MTIETRPQPAYTLLSFGEYYKLNHDISVAHGLEVGKKTERAMPMNCELAKVNIQPDETYELKMVMPISSEIQINDADIIAGYALVDSYEKADEQLSEIIATGLTSDVIDWTLIHYLRVGTVREGVVLWLEEQARTTLSDDAVLALNNLGVTIITVANE